MNPSLFRKIIVLVLIITAAFVLYASSALAEHSGTLGNLTWTLNDSGKLTISGTGKMEEENYSAWKQYDSEIKTVVIQNGVTNISNSAFEYCFNLTSVTIPASVTSIDDYAFFYCENLTSITIPDNVTTIGDWAFSYCGLTSPTIPSSVTSIGTGTFDHCPNLSAFHVSSDNTKYSAVNGILFNKSKSTLIAYPMGRTATSYSIPDSVTTIAVCAFHGNTYLESITIPSTVAIIEDNAFELCYNLSEVTISNGVQTIGNEAFSGCAMTSISIPASVTRIGRGAFVWNYIESFTVAADSPSYSVSNGVLFNKSKSKLVAYPSSKQDETYSVPDTVTSIEEQAFISCWNLKTITIPQGVTSIGELTFHDCQNLQNIIIPDTVTNISGYAFSACVNLKSIRLPKNLRTIGFAAFISCQSLTSIVIPPDVTRIDNNAFENCEKLTTVTITANETTIGDSAFDGCPKLTLKAFAGSEPMQYAEDNGIPNKAISIMSIPEGMTSIPAEAFSGSGCEAVFLPVRCKTVGSKAFANCPNLVYINIPSASTSIASDAFSGSPNVYTDDWQP